MESKIVFSVIIGIVSVLVTSGSSVHEVYGNHFISEHENHPHDLVSAGHTNVNEGINYEDTCTEDSQFIVETLPDGRKNPNYLHDEFSAYVFIVAGWGGFGLSGLQTDQREDREELINFLYDNDAQVIRGDWTWLPVDGKERYSNVNGPRCHQPGPNGQLVDSLKEGPSHNPSAWNLIVDQWKNLMSQPRTQELIQDKKIIVLGHSFGGNAVSRIGEDTETRIDLLGIADPVGHRALQYNTIFQADCLIEDPLCWLPTLKIEHCTIPGIPGVVDDFSTPCAAHFENNHPQREISSNVKKLVMAWQETELPPSDFITHTNDGAVDSNAFFTFQTYVQISESFDNIVQASNELKDDFGDGPVDDPQLISAEFSPKIHDALQPFREAIQIDPAKLGYLTSPQTEVVFQKKILGVGHSGIWDSAGTGLTELTGTYIDEMKKMNSRPTISVTNYEIVLEDGKEFLKVILEGEDQDQDNLQFKVIDPQPKNYDLSSSGSGNHIMGTLMIPTSEPRTIVLVEDDGWPCTNCKGPNAPTINGETVIEGAWNAIIILYTDGVLDTVPLYSCPGGSQYDGYSCDSDASISCSTGTTYDKKTGVCSTPKVNECPSGTSLSAQTGTCVKFRCPSGFVPNPTGSGCVKLPTCSQGTLHLIIGDCEVREPDNCDDFFLGDCYAKLDLICPKHEKSTGDDGVTCFYKFPKDDGGSDADTCQAHYNDNRITVFHGGCFATGSSACPSTYSFDLLGTLGGFPCKKSACGGLNYNVITDQCTVDPTCSVGTLDDVLFGFGAVCLASSEQCPAGTTDVGSYFCNADAKLCPSGTTFNGFSCEGDKDISCSDGFGLLGSDRCRDQTPNFISAPKDITFVTTVDNGNEVFLGNITANDPDSADVILENNAPDLFFLGNSLVTWSAMDPFGASVNVVQLVTGLSPREFKQSTIIALENLDSDNKKSTKEIAKAIKSIEVSLSDKFWEDSDTLTAKYGHRVFDEERHAVKSLLKVQKDFLVIGVSDVMDSLVLVDKILAEESYNSVCLSPTSNKVQKECNKADMEFVKAEAEDDPDKAIDKYKKAWKHAQKALKHDVNADEDSEMDSQEKAIEKANKAQAKADNASPEKQEKEQAKACKTINKEIGNLNKKGITVPTELEQLLTDNCS